LLFHAYVWVNFTELYIITNIGPLILYSDGKDDYILVNDNGSLEVWINQGKADTSVTVDGVRFADIDGDGV